uniref:methyltransferase domain-containing protein n=1 Tax=Streptomyces sp. CC228A TaxID=2898186 RepID=UPI001F2EC4CF
MFTAEGPTLRELTAQALSSVEHGYDLLAPKFDVTPFRTPAAVLESVADVLRPLGPFGAGLDLCCGTGAGTGLLRELCRERVTGVDVSAGMLARARAAHSQGDEGAEGAE